MWLAGRTIRPGDTHQGMPICTDILLQAMRWASYEKGSWVTLAQQLSAEGAQMPHLQPEWPLPNHDHDPPGSVPRHHCAMPQWMRSTWHATEGPQEPPCSMPCWGDPMWLPWMWYPTLQEGTKATRWAIPVGAPKTLKDCISSHSAKPERSLEFDSAALHFTGQSDIAIHDVLVTWSCTSDALCCVSFIISCKKLVERHTEGLTPTGNLIYKETISSPQFSHVVKSSTHTHLVHERLSLWKWHSWDTLVNFNSTLSRFKLSYGIVVSYPAFHTPSFLSLTVWKLWV